MDTLTDRQQEILDFIRERIEGDGVPPSLAEIAQAFRFADPSSAQHFVAALEAKGFDILFQAHARSILTGEFAQALIEISNALDSIHLPITEIIGSGGGETKSAEVRPASAVRSPATARSTIGAKSDFILNRLSPRRRGAVHSGSSALASGARGAAITRR